MSLFFRPSPAASSSFNGQEILSTMGRYALIGEGERMAYFGDVGLCFETLSTPVRLKALDVARSVSHSGSLRLQDELQNFARGHHYLSPRSSAGHTRRAWELFLKRGCDCWVDCTSHMFLLPPSGSVTPRWEPDHEWLDKEA